MHAILKFLPISPLPKQAFKYSQIQIGESE